MPAESVIERLRRLEAEATKGPWTHLIEANGDSDVVAPSPIPHDPVIVCNVMRPFYDMAANGDLIAETRNALPLLLAVAEAAIRLRSEWQEHDNAEHRAWTALRDLYAAADALRAGGERG